MILGIIARNRRVEIRSSGILCGEFVSSPEMIERKHAPQNDVGVNLSRGYSGVRAYGDVNCGVQDVRLPGGRDDIRGLYASKDSVVGSNCRICDVVTHCRDWLLAAAFAAGVGSH